MIRQRVSSIGSVAVGVHSSNEIVRLRRLLRCHTKGALEMPRYESRVGIGDA
jgi:hypothetical protein